MEKNKPYLIECKFQHSDIIQKFLIRLSHVKNAQIFSYETYSIKRDELTFEGDGLVCLESEISVKTELSEEQYLLLLSNK